ncbi:MAG: hypothetical protein IJ572_00905 [Bacilli bacterium]|nr:hypothetical protein [Bacilli bacterium]
MSFLEDLYSKEYFAPVLFGIIIFLAILFVVVLILAIKDGKKNKKKAEENPQSVDAFNQVEQNPTPVELTSTPDANQPVEVTPAIQEIQPEVVPTVTVGDDIVNNVTPVSDTFENVAVEPPTQIVEQNVVEPAPSAVESEVSPTNIDLNAPIELTSVPSETVVAPTESVIPQVETKEEPVLQPIENQPIQINVENPVVSEPVLAPSIDATEPKETTTDDITKAESDLDEIAATLLAEYQKEGVKQETEAQQEPISFNQAAEEVPLTSPQNDQFSSVFVTPDTLPNPTPNEAPVPENMPSLNDIPTPQPVRVVNSSTIIDSSSQNNIDINNINAEEYNINK